MTTANAEMFRLTLQGKSRADIAAVAVALFSDNQELRIRLKEFQNASHEMAVQFQQMKDELKGARREIEELRKQNLHLAGVQTIQTNELFGRSTEKTEDILDRLVNEDLPQNNPLDEHSPCTEETKASRRRRIKSLVPLFDNPGRRDGEHRRKRLGLSGLPVQTWFEYDIDELDRAYGKGNWRFAFWKGTKTVEVIRQSSYVKLTYTPVVSVGLEHSLVRIPYGNELLPKSVASPSLLSQIMVDRNRLYLPMYRQEHDTERFGFPLSRQLMSRWICYAAHTHLLPVYTYLCRLLQGYRYQQCDETYYSVIRDGRHPGAKSFIWVHRSGELTDMPPIVAYCYEKSRGAEHLRTFYKGLTDTVFLSCDAYSAYPAFASGTTGRVVLAGCYMHVRRRFVDALLVLKLGGLTDEQILGLPEVKAILLLREIYCAEQPLKELSAAERHRKRLTDVLPKVEGFFAFLHAFDLNDPLASEKLKDAVRYALNQEACLRRFLEDGNIPIDNGACERSVKPIALYRRNSLFSCTASGAEANMIIFTLIETARANGADPYYYLKYLLEQMPKHLYDKDKNFLPDMLPWSQPYRVYEIREKENLFKAQAPPGNEKPRTPKKGEPGSSSGQANLQATA